MKKRIVLSIGLIVVIMLSIVTGVFAAKKMTLIVNGQISSVDPVVINGTTYVPLRAAATMLNADVDITVESGPMVLKISKVTLNPTFKQYSFESTTQSYHT